MKQPCVWFGAGKRLFGVDDMVEVADSGKGDVGAVLQCFKHSRGNHYRDDIK